MAGSDEDVYERYGRNLTVRGDRRDLFWRRIQLGAPVQRILGQALWGAREIVEAFLRRESPAIEEFDALSTRTGWPFSGHERNPVFAQPGDQRDQNASAKAASTQMPH